MCLICKFSLIYFHHSVWNRVARLRLFSVEQGQVPRHLAAHPLPKLRGIQEGGECDWISPPISNLVSSSNLISPLTNIFFLNVGQLLFTFVTRRCWICFATEDDEPEAAWVRPCRCCGTTKWVHQICLQRWIDERQAGNATTRVSCPQCGEQYQIIFPPLGLFLQAVEDVDKFVNKASPLGAAGILVGSLYWSSVTYGAVTTMQVLGHKEGLDMMEKADPLFLLVGLPTIPLILILGKMIRWEDHLLRLWRQHVSKMSLLSYFIPRLAEPTGAPLREPAETTPLSDPISAARILCGALIMPTIATLVGRVGFPFVRSSLNRALLVSDTFWFFGI